jgi:hypothetical protein
MCLLLSRGLPNVSLADYIEHAEARPGIRGPGVHARRLRRGAPIRSTPE